MKKTKRIERYLVLAAVLCVLVIAGCSVPGGDTTAPTVASTNYFTATFSEPMDSATIVAANFTVVQGVTPVTGAVTYDAGSSIAFFTPTLKIPGVPYTATITTGVKDVAGNALAANKVWTFTSTGAPQAPVLLGAAGNYVILAESAITSVPASVITGDLGLSPAAETYYTGFSQTDVTPSGYATSSQVTGKMYAADMTPPTPSNLTTATTNMTTAYTDAAGRPTPDFLNLGSGNIGGRTLVSGLYKWGTGVTIPSNVTIAGGANDVWIFQIAGNLIGSNSIKVILAGGAQAKNIFWQLSGQATMGTNSHFEGIILSQSAITLQTGASMNGRALAQTQVALQKSTVTTP